MLLNELLPSNQAEVLDFLAKAPRHSLPEDPLEQEKVIARCLTDLRVLHHKTLGNLPRTTPFASRIHTLASKKRVTLGEARRLARAQKTVMHWLVLGPPRPLLLSQTKRFCSMEDKVGIETGQLFTLVIEEAAAILYNWKDNSSPMGMLSALLPRRVTGLWARLSTAAERAELAMQLVQSEVSLE